MVLAHRFSDVKDIRTATFVVAASDSEHKYEADYRCNGTAATGGDQVEINKAIEALISSVTDEAFNSGALDVWVTLDNNRIQRGEVVTSNGITYVRGVDYEMDYSAGMIMCLSTGGMAAATEFYIDYEYGGGCVKLLDGTFWTSGNVLLRSHVQLIGSGFGSIIKVRDSDANTIIVVTNSDITIGGDNIKVSNLVVDGNLVGGANSQRCIRLMGVNFGEVTGCLVRDITCDGIYIRASSNCIISGNIADGVGENGVSVALSEDRVVVSDNVLLNCGEDAILLYRALYCTVTGNIIEGGLQDGISLSSDSHHNVISNNSILGCAQEGIQINDSFYNIISGNRVQESGYNGICINVAHHNSVIGNIVTESSQDADITYVNISIISGDYNLISGNLCRQGILANQPAYGIKVSPASSEKNIIQGNDLYDAGQTSNFYDTGTCTIVEDDNRNITPVQVKHLVYAQNTSGGNLLTGNVVAYEVTGAAAGFHSPTAIGDPMVWGMLAEDIDNNAFGYIQVLGGTVVLDATNVGGGAIVIGDLLCTEVGSRARKAAAGHIVFAIAMEDLDAVDGVINALLITPRMI